MTRNPNIAVTTRNVFLRLNNRKKRLSVSDFRKAGYPIVRVDHRDLRHEHLLYKICCDNFQNGKGENFFVKIGDNYCFDTKDDAYLFQGLMHLY